MTKKFYRLALILNIATALLSVIFAIIYYVADQNLDSGSLLTFLFYVKKFFDLLAVFTGYGTIMYAFTRYDFKCGLTSIGIFSISVVISFLYQVIGTCIYDNKFALDFILFTIYYACGTCIITQLLPALIIALCTHFATKDKTNKYTLLRIRGTVTLIIFGINLLVQLIFNVLAFLIECEFLIYADELWSIIGSILETIVIYGGIQFGMYYLTHYVYSKFTDETTLPPRKKKKTPALDDDNQAQADSLGVETENV